MILRDRFASQPQDSFLVRSRDACDFLQVSQVDNSNPYVSHSPQAKVISITGRAAINNCGYVAYLTRMPRLVIVRMRSLSGIGDTLANRDCGQFLTLWLTYRYRDRKF